ncbi:SlyX family protein [Adhaeretor mobilis]|uniref:Phage lysis protein n=1 Tax=Adhaeretor mobilis TaxID=1930276 RepID=A0A517MPH4_9BACT|nr:SlyX family protein [Adhaeretor mobilis]QDS96796.1 phage lysis protein [Adhaeretor mobilis]
MSKNDAEARLILVEERLAFLEQQVEQLNEVILSQQQDLTNLRRKLATSEQTVERLSNSLGEDLPHEPPPHY